MSNPTNYDPAKDKERLEDVRSWVYDYFSWKLCSISPSGQLVINGRKIEGSKFLADMKLQYDFEFKRANRSLHRDLKISPPTNGILEAAMEAQIDERWWLELDGLRDKMKNTKIDFDFVNIRKFVKASVGSDDSLHVHALAHWLWQAKRKINGLPVRDHLMLVFSGQQGSGKSTALSLLTESIKDYRLDWNLQALADGRNYHGINKNFVIVFDEMMGCNKTDIETLKHFITTDRLTARKLFTNSLDSLPQNCSCLGTSNKYLDTLIRDETGMRRFFEFKCSEKMDWELLNSVDPVEIWREVDEVNNHGYLREVRDELKAEQETYRFQNSVEIYIHETHAKSGSLLNEVSTESIFSDYVDWCRQSEERPQTKQLFGKSLRSLGITPTRKSLSRGYLVGTGYVPWRLRDAAKIQEARLKEMEDLLTPAEPELPPKLRNNS